MFAAIGWTSAVVAGASMGGCVSLAFAGRHSARVRGLGLFDTTAWYGAEAPAQWAERADKAVYHAKQNGRNQVASFGELVARGVFQDDKVESDIELF